MLSGISAPLFDSSSLEARSLLQGVALFLGLMMVPGSDCSIHVVEEP